MNNKMNKLMIIVVAAFALIGTASAAPKTSGNRAKATAPVVRQCAQPSKKQPQKCQPQKHQPPKHHADNRGHNKNCKPPRPVVVVHNDQPPPPPRQDCRDYRDCDDGSGFLGGLVGGLLGCLLIN